MKLDTLIPLVGIFLLLFKPQLNIPWVQPSPSPSPAPVPGPGPIVPVSGTITQILAGQKADAAQVAAFFTAFASLVEKDSAVLKSNDDFYKAYSNAGMLMFQGLGIKGKYPNLAATIDQQLQAACPLTIQPLSPDKRQALVAALRSVAAQAAAVK